MDMKIRIALSAVLMSAVFALAGCSCAGGVNEEVTDTTPIMTDETEMNENNGDYDVEDDGAVTEEIPETEALPEENKDGVIEPEVTDDGIVDGDEVVESRVTDEVAYASSYIDNEKICWGLGKEHDELGRPLDAVNAEVKYKAIGGRFLPEGKKICLTFDEGYENGYTSEILDTLKSKDVKAVFFVTYDYCTSSPELVKRIIDEGHILGNHSYSHPSFPDCTEEDIEKEVMTLHNYVKDNFGYEMKLFRFPKGEFTPKNVKLLSDLGYTSVFWSFAYADWDPEKQPDKAEAYARITESTHSGIYLLHAVSSTNSAVLGSVIDFWKAKGYEVGSQL